ncbi:hypothetical protein D3C78_1772320 [compost metagenome]
MQRALAELVTQRCLQAPRQTLVGDLLDTRSRGVVTLGIEHPPLGERIDHQRLLFQGEEA